MAQGYNMPANEILTVQEVADYLKVKPTTMRQWIRQGELEANKFGGEWRVSDEQLQAFMEKHRGTRG